ncbi:hypothetical protein IT575_04465 [bacterium]|nr:hypothetical protein [bacterium]
MHLDSDHTSRDRPVQGDPGQSFGSSAASRKKWQLLIGALVVMVFFNVLTTWTALRYSAALQEERLEKSGRLYYGEYLDELTKVSTASIRDERLTLSCIWGPSSGNEAAVLLVETKDLKLDEFFSRGLPGPLLFDGNYFLQNHIMIDGAKARIAWRAIDPVKFPHSLSDGTMLVDKQAGTISAYPLDRGKVQLIDSGELTVVLALNDDDKLSFFYPVRKVTINPSSAP